MNISVCIITKNDSQRLRRCLNSLRHYNIEVVVVDTGSTDDTIKILDELKKDGYPIKICYFEWINDFSQARNYAASQATNDLILVLDSDEYIAETECDFDKLIRDNSSKPERIGRIKIINMYDRNGEQYENYEYINRVYDRRYHRFEGKIHEQLEPKTATFETDIIIRHDGYTGTKEELRKKTERNITLLIEELKNNGESPYVLYQLGKSNYMQGGYKEAAEYFDKALYYDLDPKLEYVIDMVETYGYALLNSGQAQKALLFEGIYDEFATTADFKFLMGLIYMNNEMFEKAVEEFLKATRTKQCRVSGTNSYRAYYNAGVIRELTGEIEEARMLYEKCGEYEKAKERLTSLEAAEKDIR